MTPDKKKVSTMQSSSPTEKTLIKYRVRATFEHGLGDDALELAAFVLEAESVEAARAEARSYECVIWERFEDAHGTSLDGPMDFTVTPLEDWIKKSIAYGKELAAARDEQREAE